LAAAVLITLFELFRRLTPASVPLSGAERLGEAPLPRNEQEECIRLIIRKLEDQGFIHPTNRRHTTEMLHDLLGRLAMTDRDRRLLLAVFSHAGNPG